MLCGDRDETMNHRISERNKLEQKEYNTRYSRVKRWSTGVVYQKLKFDHTNKWYMHNPETVQENEMHVVLWDFEIQTDHLISTWQPKKEKKDNLLNSGLGRSCWRQDKTERKRKAR